MKGKKHWNQQGLSIKKQDKDRDKIGSKANRIEYINQQCKKREG